MYIATELDSICCTELVREGRLLEITRYNNTMTHNTVGLNKEQVGMLIKGLQAIHEVMKEET